MNEDVAAQETRTAIYKNALFLIYRLLFVLYAEARDLLPLDVPAYQEICLRDLLAEVRHNHQHGTKYDGDEEIWTRLQSLFSLIDVGQPEAGVPAYNGGLFDPSRRPFLTRHSIRNDYLQAALIRLSTMPARGKSYDQDRSPRPIDYRDLSVRHLGSLYEGLLEYNLFIVEDEPHVVRVGKKRTQYVPYSKAGKVRSNETILKVGDVYFSETAGERKATGSYYTPEDVVDYIVHHTIGVKLKELGADFENEQEIERQLADLADTPAHIPVYRQIQRALDDQFLRFVSERVLALKILDPAMGSGHFLVNATHAVANFTVEYLNETPWKNSEIDTDVATWKRQVAEHCIFGVDLNELAVELARLCLWMTTAAKGKPLTFLDHHLRWGNSLVGAWLQDVGVYPLAKKESKQIFTLPLDRFQVELGQVLASYDDLYAKNSDAVEEVREKARIFDEEIYPALQSYREMLDLHTGVHFGNGLKEPQYAQLGTAVNDSTAWSRLKAMGLSDLVTQHSDQHWFHWELEFPEVFSGEKPGFDVVIGNPPYVRQERFFQQKAFFQSSFNKVYHGGADLYVYFIVQGVKNLANSGLLGYITANKWLKADYAIHLRDYLSNQAKPIQLLDYGHSKVFPGTDTFPCILVVGTRNERDANNGRLLFADVSDRVRGKIPLRDYVVQQGFEIPFANLKKSGWILESAGVSGLLSKIGDLPKLGKQVDVDALFGIKTGYDAAFCIDSLTRNRLVQEDPNCEPLIHKFLRGRTVKRWRPIWDDDWMIAIPSSTNETWPWSDFEDPQKAENIFQQTYPSLYNHLKIFERRLRNRNDQGRFWWELRSCDYYAAFKRPKIVVQQILYQPVFALDTENYWANPMVYSITTDNLYVLAVLNSRIMWWYLYRIWPHKKDEALNVQKPKLLHIPIPTASNSLNSQIKVLVKQAHEIAGKDDKLSELLEIETQLNDYVIEAFKLSQAEVATINSTLPPRDPLVVLQERVRKQK